MSLLRWLYPGLGVKRWLVLFAVAVGIAGFGIALAVHTDTVFFFELALSRILFNVTGRFLAPQAAGLILVLTGAVLAAVSIQRTVQALVSALTPVGTDKRLGERLVQQRLLGRGPRIVAIGGGTGLSTLLRGLKEYSGNLTAIVTVTDEGGSSGRLRGELGILPPGDIRNVLVALADTEPLMEQLFQHRFTRGGLSGHSLGNLFIGALVEILGDFEAAVRASSQVLAIRGLVLPSTTDDVRLVAETERGERVVGEADVVRVGLEGQRIVWMGLDPPGAKPVASCLEALEQAEVVVLGPGSLYTSILPNLLVPEIAQALRRSRALRLFVVNVMTQPGETTGFSAADHLEALYNIAGQGLVDALVVNTAPVDDDRLTRYLQQGAEPVRVDEERLHRLGVRVLTADLLNDTPSVRHDPRKLAHLIVREALRAGPREAGRLIEHMMLLERLRRERKRME